jgi:hypothetical protein
MTAAQKKAVKHLFEGCTIASLGSSGYRLRDAAGNPLMRLTPRTFNFLRNGNEFYPGILRKRKSLFVINLSNVRKWHGNSYIKKLYNNQ